MTNFKKMMEPCDLAADHMVPPLSPKPSPCFSQAEEETV